MPSCQTRLFLRFRRATCILLIEGDARALEERCIRRSPGLTLPLNLDACSTAAYGLVNSTFLQAFQGTLDSNGRGRATLKIPAKALRGTLRTHMAALVFDRVSGQFRAVTNAVELSFK